jgi:conjugal transfer pilus assembly protein TraD
MNNEGKFERILRPLFEVRSVYAWVFATIWCLLWSVALNFGKGTILILACITLSMATWRFLSVLGLAKLRLALIGKPIAFITTDTLQKALPAMGNQLWLGWGLRWQPRHTRRAHELMGRDIEDIYPPTWILRLLGSKRVPANERGLQWIHGLEEKEKDILAPFDSLKGHCAVLATTGAIKTRLVALIMYQLAARGDTVILLDPKGDPELRAI